MKRFIALLTLLVIAAVNTYSEAGNVPEANLEQMDISQEEREIIQMIGEDRFVREGKACDAYDRLLASFSSDPLTRGDDYPAFYGGAFVDENGDLVINVTNKDAAVIETLTAITGLSEIKIQTVSYSYAELVKMSDELQDRLAFEEPKLMAMISGFGIDQERCLVRVYVNHTTEEDEEAIRALADDPEAIIFVRSSGNITEETSVIPN